MRSHINNNVSKQTLKLTIADFAVCLIPTVRKEIIRNIILCAVADNRNTRTRALFLSQIVQIVLQRLNLRKEG